jgi:hypothetical protein
LDIPRSKARPEPREDSTNRMTRGILVRLVLLLTKAGLEQILNESQTKMQAGRIDCYSPIDGFSERPAESYSRVYGACNEVDGIATGPGGTHELVGTLRDRAHRITIGQQRSTVLIYDLTT